MPRIYEWTVTNTSNGRISFDDTALEAMKSTTIYRLTNDVLSGWRQGKLLIKPDPGEAIPGLKTLFTLDPCQFPLAVKIVGPTGTPESNTLVDGAPIVVASADRTQIVIADKRRRVLRVKNIGNHTVWLGGSGVTNLNSLLPLAPGEIYTEKDVPAAAWWAYSAANLANESTSLLVQQVYAGIV